MPKLGFLFIRFRGQAAAFAILTLLFVGLTARADEGVPCGDSLAGLPPPPPITELEEVLSHVDWWSASDDQITGAPCRAGVPTDTEMRDWLTADAAGPTATRTIHGVTLRDQPVALLDLFERLATTRGRQPAAQSTFTIPSDCQEFHCAIDSIFPDGTGLRIAYLAGRYGFNASHHAGSPRIGGRNISPLEGEELDDVIAGIADMPPHLKRLMHDHPLHHFTRGRTLAIYALTPVLANASISLFDRWTNVSRPRRQYTVLHEAAHALGGELGLDESERWLNLSRWKRIPDPPPGESEWIAANHRVLPSEYSAESPGEDFAESVVAYRYNPDLLRTLSPGKYAFIRDLVYDGVEFTSESACTGATTGATRLRESLLLRAREDLTSRPWTERLQSTDAPRACRDQIFDYVATPGSSTGALPASLRSCVSGAMILSFGRSSSTDSEYLRVLNVSGAFAEGEEVFSGDDRRFARAIRSSVREGIRDVIEKEFVNPRNISFVVSLRDRRSPARYCEERSRYSYQHATVLAAAFEANRTRGPGFMFDRREDIARWTRDVCLRIFGDAATISRPADGAVDAAINRVFGPDR